jgi:hypothetical protein
MVKYFFLILTCLLLGCESRKRISILKIEGSPDFQKSVYSSLNEIEKNFNRRLFFKSGNYPVFIKETQVPQDPIDPELNNKTTISTIADAQVFPNFCLIRIQPTNESDDIQILNILHEIGHCVGLDHPEIDHGTIMDAMSSDIESQQEQMNDLPDFIKSIQALTFNDGFDNDKMFFYPILKMFTPFDNEGEEIKSYEP